MKKNILLLLVSLFLVFILMEIGFRLYCNYANIYEIEMHKYAKKLKRRSPIEGLSHEHIPNKKAELMGVEIAINENGFRDIQIENAHETLILGSSITMGWGVEYDSVFTTLWENFLNEISDEKINIVNSGVGNYNTHHQQIFLKEYLKSHQPQDVILHYFINDAEILPPENHNFFVKHSYLIAYLYVRIKQTAAVRNKTYENLGDYYEQLYDAKSKGWQEAQRNILKMKNLCNSKGINFGVYLQPDLHDLSEDSKQAKCHKKIHDFLNQNKIPFLDFMPTFRKQIKNPKDIWVNSDDSHPNAKGHLLMLDCVLNIK